MNPIFFFFAFPSISLYYFKKFLYWPLALSSFAYLLLLYCTHSVHLSIFHTLVFLLYFSIWKLLTICLSHLKEICFQVAIYRITFRKEDKFQGGKLGFQIWIRSFTNYVTLEKPLWLTKTQFIYIMWMVKSVIDISNMSRKY